MLFQIILFPFKEETHSLELVAETEVFKTPSAEGVYLYDIFETPLNVKAGNILGLEYLDRNPIPYHHNGAQCESEDKTL